MINSKTTSILKKQLVGAIASVLAAFVALSSATYAWYVTNNTVKATTSADFLSLINPIT